MYPALAVARELSAPAADALPAAADAAARQTDAEAGRPCTLVYIGSEGGMEADIVTRESSLPFRALPAAAMRGRGPLALLRGLLTLLRGTLAARQMLKQLRPEAILGTGGYVCVPLFVAARMQGIPTIIYLPDVVPGLAVRLLARLATAVACNVEDSRRYLPATGSRQHPLLVVGYPVRAALFTQEQAACRAAFGLDEPLPVLMIYGGSRGARSINRAIEVLLPHILELAQVIHICGREGDEAWLQDAAARLEPRLQARYRLYPYLDERSSGTMVQAFGAADLALCRSGASTMAELPAAGLPAILVPYPYVHQEENADYLVRHGAAVKVHDAAMLGEGEPQDGMLFTYLQTLLTDSQQRQQMAQHSRRLARPAAARHLAGVLCNLATRSEIVWTSV